MSDKPARPILSLKSGFKPKLPPPAPLKWKCKPCGAAVTVTGTEDEAAEVRCPQCNARLGLAKDFNVRPPNVDKVRARLVP